MSPQEKLTVHLSLLVPSVLQGVCSLQLLTFQNVDSSSSCHSVGLTANIIRLSWSVVILSRVMHRIFISKLFKCMVVWSVYPIAHPHSHRHAVCGQSASQNLEAGCWQPLAAVFHSRRACLFRAALGCHAFGKGAVQLAGLEGLLVILWALPGTLF